MGGMGVDKNTHKRYNIMYECERVQCNLNVTK